VVEHGPDVGDVRELDVVGLGAPEPTRVVPDHPVPLREGRHLLVPHPEAAEPAVDQQQRMAVALDLLVDPGAVDLDETRLAYEAHARKDDAGAGFVRFSDFASASSITVLKP
jgi:hypothetical protein